MKILAPVHPGSVVARAVVEAAQMEQPVDQESCHFVPQAHAISLALEYRSIHADYDFPEPDSGNGPSLSHFGCQFESEGVRGYVAAREHPIESLRRPVAEKDDRNFVETNPLRTGGLAFQHRRGNRPRAARTNANPSLSVRY